MTLTPAIQLEEVWLSVQGKPVLEAVSLTLEQGAFLGLIGPNGAGKTALLKVILGIMTPDRGVVRVLGRPPGEVRGEIGYVPQHAEFDADFPIRVLDVALMGRLRRNRLFRPFGASDRRLAMAALERVRIAHLANRLIGKLSGGELQRVLIARALMVEPKILLLDEPTASLDTLVGMEFHDLLGDLSERMTLILVSHDIGVISRQVKTIACLNRRLHYHHSKELTGDMIEAAYGCPVDLLAHGHPHRVLDTHRKERDR